MPSFEIGSEHFLLNGVPHRIMAGAVHYFRVHPALWADRIHKARMMGLNTIETYIPWNAHAPRRGDFDTSGGLDLAAFLDLIAAEGMHAIVRPGPYICAEWHNGGLPAWLTSNPAVGIRRNEPLYMAAVAEYYDQIMPIIAPRQIDRGGPVILVQVENEYGAYGDDKTYLTELVRLTRAGGITVPLTTVDQPTDEMLENGRIDGAHLTASFGSRSIERLKTLRAHQLTGPLMCSEYWNGWFDNWGSYHHTTSPIESAVDLRQLMGTGASFSLYMFHGGTNFGLTSGANDKGIYQPIVTSYDYDAPLAENGEPTEKYWAFREVIGEFHELPLLHEGLFGEHPVDAPTFDVALGRTASLLDIAETREGWREFDSPPTSDALEAYDGFTLYRAVLPSADNRVLSIDHVRDRAFVFVNRIAVGTLSRSLHETVLGLPGGDQATVEILVEDEGRVNYGPRIGEPKGLVGDVRVNGEIINAWSALPLSSLNLSEIVDALTRRSAPVASTRPVAGPTFLAGSFEIIESVDLYLDSTAWGKGVAWINGFNLGRYWSAGPQRTLYVPAGTLRSGANELVLLELQGVLNPVARFVSDPQLGPSSDL